MGRVETTLGVVGVLATLFGVGLLVAPEVVQTGPVGGLTDVVAGVDPTQLMLGLGIATALLVAVVGWPRSKPDNGGTQLDETVDRQTKDRTRDDLLGSELETAIREGGEPWRQARSTLAETAATSYARQAGVPAAVAEAAVGRGEWTDDDIAAGVLAGEVPYSARLRLWLVPERERRRRIERTVTAIERLQRQ
jgi:hypothetical protein